MEQIINIEKIIPGGLGLGRMNDGMVVMTRYVLPGETVRVAVTVRHRGYLEAELLHVLDPSKNRVRPLCPIYGECGGCDLQHATESAQHRIKEDIVCEAMIRARINYEEDALRPFLPSPHSFAYRYRIRLKISSQGKIGFYRIRSRQVVPLTECPVATAPINHAITELNDSRFTKKLIDFCQELELLHSEADDQVSAVLHIMNKKRPDRKILDDFASSLQSIHYLLIKEKRGIKSVASDRELPVLQQEFDGSFCGKPYVLSWSPGCFSQVNAQQNRRLIQLTCQLIGDVRGQRLLDLFCGTGNFSVPLGLLGASVTGIEQNRESIIWAASNADKAALTTSRFQLGDAGTEIRRLTKTHSPFDCVLLDPPRRGLGKDISLLKDLGPERIIYISCDPATLMRDLNVLTTGGYALLNLTPVDMFPQTHHIESVALLEKN